MRHAGKIFLVLFCAAVAVSSVAFAEGNLKKNSAMGGCEKMRPQDGGFMGGHHMMGMHKGMGAEHGMDRLFFFKVGLILGRSADIGLTDDQKEKVETLKYNFLKTIIKDIKEGLRKDEADIKTINGLLDKEYVAKAQKAKDAVEACVNLNKIITKDQQKKLKEMRSHRAMEMGWKQHGAWGKGNKNPPAQEANVSEENE